MTPHQIAIWVGLIGLTLIVWGLINYVAFDAVPAVHELVK